MPAGLPRPGTLRWLVLAWLVRNEDGTAGEIADAVDPPPRFTTPIANGRIYRHRQTVRAAHRADARGRVRLALSALQRRGLIESAAAVRLESWAADAWETEGPPAVLRHVWDVGLVAHFDGDADPDEVEGEESPEGDGGTAERIIQALADAPMRRGALCLAVTGRKKESGAFDRAYSRLADRGIIAPPSLRRPTEQGRALIAEGDDDV